jgi:hypothetical protein
MCSKNKLAHVKIEFCRWMIFTILCSALASCGQLEFEDVSTDSRYSAAIGSVFSTKKDMWAIGVTADRNYKRQVDYIVLAPDPGFHGPEVVRKERVGKQSVFRVRSVLKGSTFGSSRVIYVVEDVHSVLSEKMPVQITVTGEVSDPNLGLD